MKQESEVDIEFRICILYTIQIKMKPDNRKVRPFNISTNAYYMSYVLPSSDNISYFKNLNKIKLTHRYVLYI